MSAVELSGLSGAGKPAEGGWQEAADRIAERVGDWLNPILIKEARQALKSRQFLVTFSLLLFAAWGWTAAAILMSMPSIYYIPTGQYFFYGYYLVLAVPMLLVVPLAAHRSLASEVDDGTLDLLSVTSLSPMQIIMGKLASAGLQMMLYFVALFPCVAFCYVLRGVDLLTIAGVLGLTVFVGSLLTVGGLFLAALPSGRSGQLTMLIIMLILVVLAEAIFGGMAFAMIDSGLDESPRGMFFAATTWFLFTVTLAAVLLRAAAAQLSPPSENRSTPIRQALLAHQCLMIGTLAYAVFAGYANSDSVIGLIYYAAAFWGLVGALMVGEGNFLTPRIRRDLPSSFVARSLLTWFTPGPSTGLVFAIIGFATFAICALGLSGWIPNSVAGFQIFTNPEPHVWALAGYMMLILSVTRGCMALIRLHSNTQPSVALAVMVIVAGMFVVIPYGISMHVNNYRTISWSYGQITNWVWSMALLMDGRLDAEAPFRIFLIGLFAFGVALVTTGRAVLPLRVATPERVVREERLQRMEEQDEEEVADPLAS